MSRDPESTHERRNVIVSILFLVSVVLCGFVGFYLFAQGENPELGYAIAFVGVFGAGGLHQAIFEQIPRQRRRRLIETAITCSGFIVIAIAMNRDSMAITVLGGTLIATGGILTLIDTVRRLREHKAARTS